MTTERTTMYSPPNPPVTLILGAHCPSCGGVTLGVRESKIVCLGRGCPDWAAAHNLLAHDECVAGHVLTFDDQGFHVQHPLLERAAMGGEGWACSLGRVIACLRQPLGIGRFRVPGDDLREVTPLTDSDVLDPDYIGAIDKALAFHPLDDFAVGTVVMRAQYLAPGDDLPEGWLPCDGESELDPAEYPEFAAVHLSKGGDPDQPIVVPDLRHRGDMVLRVR